MSDSPETRFRVGMCDGSVDVKGRLDSRADLDDLIARLKYAADFVWPQEGAGDEAPSVSHETQAPRVVNGVPPRRGAEPITPVRLAQMVAEQLSDDEFERLTPRQAEAIALRRAGVALSVAAVAMRLSGTSGVVGLINAARERGVEVDARPNA